MVRLRARAPQFEAPDWVLSFTPTAEHPTGVDWYRAVRSFCRETALVDQDLETWLYVVSNARQAVVSTWGQGADRPDLSAAIRTATDHDLKEAHDGR